MNINSIRLFCAVFIVVASLTIISLERLFPYKKGQKFFREGFFQDFIFYSLAQNFLMGLFISYLTQFMDDITTLSRLRIISGFSVWTQIIFFFVIHDFYIYWFHKYQHKSKIFWRIHEAHHSNTDVDWLAGSKSHMLEILINQTVEFAPVVLLGAAPEVAIIKGTIDAVWGMYIHSNINVRSGWLQYFINGPEMHRWHHADKDEESYNKNFGTKLALWDWLFGTAYLPENKKPSFYGLSYLNFPKNYFSQQLYAFRKFTKDDI